VKTTTRGIVACLSVAASALILGLSAAGAVPESGLATIAGSGRLGFADGTAQAASFIAPAGIARGLDGTVYVADAGAQRIRAIRDGSVTTIAGSGPLDADGLWVYGGYQDGSVASARFDDPHGIVVDAQGRIYVADTDNRCIRLIDHGIVSTYAGMCGDPGGADGKPGLAHFQRPYQLALASDGTLYVADFGNGVREITSDRTVSTIYRSDSVTGVSVSPSGHVVFIADQTGIAWMTGGGTAVIHSRQHQRDAGDPHPATGPDLGRPYELTAVNEHAVLYTDLESGAIRYLDTYSGTERVLVGGEASSDVGFRDGRLESALVADPVGLTADENGAFVIADTGNRRIRRLSLNVRTAVVPARGEAIPTPSAGVDNVAFVGNSVVYDGTLWDDSIEGLFEERASAGGRPLKAQAIVMQGASLSAILQYVDLLAESRVTNEVVLFIDDGLLLTSGKEWEHELNTDLTATSKRLRAAGIKLVVVYHPDAYDVQWSDYPRLWANYDGGPVQLSFGVTYGRVRKDLRAAGPSVVDLWPVFTEAMKSPAHVPLYGTTDAHFSAAGRRVVADALAKALIDRR
jgi:streptogramin lyase